MTEASPGGKRNLLWWIYFGYYILALVWGAFLQLTNSPVRGFTIMSVLFDLVGLLGLYGFLRYKPFASRAFWIVFTLLFLCRMAWVLHLFVQILVTFGWKGTGENYVTLLGIAGVLLALPALAAFGLYAFRSPEIWERGD